MGNFTDDWTCFARCCRRNFSIVMMMAHFDKERLQGVAKVKRERKYIFEKKKKRNKLHNKEKETIAEFFENRKESNPT